MPETVRAPQEKLKQESTSMRTGTGGYMCARPVLGNPVSARSLHYVLTQVCVIALHTEHVAARSNYPADMHIKLHPHAYLSMYQYIYMCNANAWNVSRYKLIRVHACSCRGHSRIANPWVLQSVRLLMQICLGNAKVQNIVEIN